LICQTVSPQYTNITDRQTRQDIQRSDSTGWTVLQTVAQKWHKFYGILVGVYAYLYTLILSVLLVRATVLHKSWQAITNKKLSTRWDSKREIYDIFNFYAMRLGSDRIRWNNAKQGPLRHSRSPILVPIESSYTTSY